MCSFVILCKLRLNYATHGHHQSTRFLWETQVVGPQQQIQIQLKHTFA